MVAMILIISFLKKCPNLVGLFVTLIIMSLTDDIGIIFDAGSETTKAGFAGEGFPRCVIPTAIGRFRHQGLIDGTPMIYCGKEAIKKRGISRLTFPVQDGLIEDWDEMEKFWHHIYYKELLVPPEQTRVLHSCHPLATTNEKARLAEILFESFAIRELYIAKSPMLILSASGKTTGVVWDNGSSCCTITPVFEGFPLEYSTLTSELSGKNLTNRLQNMLSKLGYSFTTPFDLELLHEMKVKECYVCYDYTTELMKPEKKNRFDLPDGQHVLLGSERYLCPELLFQPSLEGLKCPSIPDLICSSINKCDFDYKHLFHNNIVVSGGSTLYPGMISRLQSEISSRVKEPGIKVDVTGIKDRQYACWAGGSMLASIDTMKGFWLTSKEYEDAGSERARYKFF